jgi:quercetin dioxygenase-like cupin family protein
MADQRPEDRDLHPRVLAVELADEITALKSESAWQRGDRNAKTLYKDAADLRIVLTVLKSGAVLAKHSAPGPVTIQILEGRGRLQAGDQDHDLQRGSLVALERNEEHSLEAVDDCAVLISIAWPSNDARV